MLCKKCGHPLPEESVHSLRECPDCGYPIFRDEDEEIDETAAAPTLKRIYFGRSDQGEPKPVDTPTPDPASTRPRGAARKTQNPAPPLPPPAPAKPPKPVKTRAPKAAARPAPVFAPEDEEPLPPPPGALVPDEVPFAAPPFSSSMRRDHGPAFIHDDENPFAAPPLGAFDEPHEIPFAGAPFAIDPHEALSPPPDDTPADVPFTLAPRKPPSEPALAFGARPKEELSPPPDFVDAERPFTMPPRAEKPAVRPSETPDPPETPAPKPATKTARPNALGESPLTSQAESYRDSSADLKQALQVFLYPGAAPRPGAASKPLLLKKPAPKLPPRAVPEADEEMPAPARRTQAPLSPPAKPLAQEPEWTRAATPLPARDPRELRKAPLEAKPSEERRALAFADDEAPFLATRPENEDSYSLGDADADEETETSSTKPSRLKSAFVSAWERARKVFAWEPQEEDEEGDESEAAEPMPTPAREEAPPPPRYAPIPAPAPAKFQATPTEEEPEAWRVVVASANRRFAAALIDAFLALFLTWAYWQGALFEFGRERLPNGEEILAVPSLLMDYSGLFPLFILTYGAIWFFGALSFTALSGQTPGQLAFGLRVIQLDGERVSLRLAFIRLLAFVLALAPFGLGLLWIIPDANKQGLHDKLAQTLVIHLGADDEEAELPEEDALVDN